MLRFFLSFSLSAVALFGVAPATRAQTSAPPPSATPAPSALHGHSEPIAPPARNWAHTESVRGSLGWRDNVLLSPFAPLQRGFVRGEFEMIAHARRRQFEFVSFLNGDVLRYFSPPPETSGEQLWSGHLEGRWQPRDFLRFSLKALGYLQDTVLDLSETEAARVVAPVRVRGGHGTAAIRFTLPGGFTVEPLAQVKRTDYRDYPGDYREEKTGARIGWRRGETLALSAAWFEHRRRYVERTRYTAGGRALQGTLLRFQQREADIKAATGWSAGGKWTAAVLAGRLENRDGGSGYFDYDQKRIRGELGWEGAAWRAIFEGEARRADYRVQTVGAGSAPPARIADSFDLSGRLERDLDARWTAFAEYRWERNRSNEAEFNYRANTILTGLQRSF